MDSVQLQKRVADLLGFRVTERENDAVVEFFTPDGEKVRAVRPAQAAEVTMYLRLLGLVARIDEVVVEGEALRDSNNALLRLVSRSSIEVDQAETRAKKAETSLDEAIEVNNRLENSLNSRTNDILQLSQRIRHLEETIEGLKEDF